MDTRGRRWTARRGQAPTQAGRGTFQPPQNNSEWDDDGLVLLRVGAPPYAPAVASPVRGARPAPGAPPPVYERPLPSLRWNVPFEAPYVP